MSAPRLSVRRQRETRKPSEKITELGLMLSIISLPVSRS